MPQNAFLELPGKLPDAARLPKMCTKKTSWAQLGSKMLQDRAKMGLEASKMTQGCPRLAQEDPPWTELRPKMLHDRAKMGPPWAQLGTKKPKHRSKIGPGRDDVSSRQPCWPRYSSPDLQEELQDTELPTYLPTCYQRGAGGMGRSPLDIYICQYPYPYPYPYI